jgi:hypothetical protein
VYKCWWRIHREIFFPVSNITCFTFLYAFMTYLLTLPRTLLPLPQPAWRNTRSYASVPPYVFIMWCLIKQRDLTFTDKGRIHVRAVKKLRLSQKERNLWTSWATSSFSRRVFLHRVIASFTCVDFLVCNLSFSLSPRLVKEFTLLPIIPCNFSFSFIHIITKISHSSSDNLLSWWPRVDLWSETEGHKVPFKQHWRMSQLQNI